MSKLNNNMNNDELMMINNNDFFNDDIYDYKDTFVNSRKRNNLAERAPVSSRPNGSGGGGAGIFNCYDMDEEFNNNVYDAGGEDEEEIDPNNDFVTGPLAAHSNNNNTNNFNSHFFDEDGQQQQEDPAEMDTFFKRVDSMELVKPKKTKIVNNYLIGELLGDGSYGKVKECLELGTLSRRAVKIINLKMVGRKIPRGVENVRKEIRIMRRLDHRNLIRLYGTFEKGGPGGGAAATTTRPTAATNTNSGVVEDELLRSSAAIVNSLEKPPKIYIFMDYCITSLEKLLKSAPDQRLRNYQVTKSILVNFRTDFRL